MKMQIDCLRELYKENLKRKLRHLIIDLQRELEQLDKDENYRPNSCGIIQGSASDIDELCIKLGVLDAVEFWRNL